MRVGLLLLIAVVAGLTIQPIRSDGGQTNVNRPFNSNPIRYRVSNLEPVAGPRSAVTGAPYSGRQISGMFRRTYHEWLYRDSEGRTRTERPMFSPPTSDLDTRMVQLVDPVSGYQYLLDTVNRIAHRMKSAPPGETVASFKESDQALQGILNSSRFTLHFDTLIPRLRGWPAPLVSMTDLGARWIDGVLAKGVRMSLTFTAAAGDVQRPVVVTTEAWSSEERKIIVLSRRDDPVNGSWETKLSEYKAGNPDPDLFRIPEGYTVIDQAGPFSLDIAMPNKDPKR